MGKSKQNNQNSLCKEIELLRDELILTKKQIEGLRGVIKGLSNENEAICMEKGQLCKETEKNKRVIDEMEYEVGELKVSISSDNGGESKGLKEEINKLLGENQEKEAEIWKLSSALSRVCNEKDDCVMEIVELQRELNMVLEKFALLEEMNCLYAKEIKRLESVLFFICSERDDLGKALEKERNNVKVLEVQVVDVLKKLEETSKLKEYFKAGVEERSEIEARYDKMLKENEVKIVNLERSIQWKTMMFESVVNMVRNATEQLSIDDTKAIQLSINNIKSTCNGVNGHGLNEDLEPIVVDLATLRAVFRRKEAEVGEMVKKIKILECSLVESKKKNGFWKWVSSATTILAAFVSFAYVSHSILH